MTLDENPGPRHLNPGPRHLKNKPGPLTPPSPPAPLPPPPSSPRCPAGELQQLQNVKQQRLDAANRRKHGIYEVYRYVENSRQDFRGTVLGPILLEIGSIARPQVAAFLAGARGLTSVGVARCSALTDAAFFPLFSPSLSLSAPF